MRPPVCYFASGLVSVHPEVRQAMTRDIVPHRSPGFKRIWRSIEGVEERWQRHESLREATAVWAEGACFEYASENGARSPTVSCFKAPSEPAAADLVNKLARRGFVIGSGCGRVKNKSFRIGHMAEISGSDLESLFEAIGTAVHSENGKKAERKPKERTIGRV